MLPGIHFCKLTDWLRDRPCLEWMFASSTFQGFALLAGRILESVWKSLIQVKKVSKVAGPALSRINPVIVSQGAIEGVYLKGPTILFKIITRMKLLFSNCLGRYSYSFQGSSEVISIAVTVSFYSSRMHYRKEFPSGILKSFWQSQLHDLMVFDLKITLPQKGGGKKGWAKKWPKKSKK